jgi:hypothetical protein
MLQIAVQVVGNTEWTAKAEFVVWAESLGSGSREMVGSRENGKGSL